MFSRRFGPKLIEVKTLLSNSCPSLKYRAVRRNKITWEGRNVNEGFRKNEKKVGFGFSRVEKRVILPSTSRPYRPPADHWLAAPPVLHSGRVSEYTALLRNILGTAGERARIRK